MGDNKIFNELLDAYLAGKATPEEYTELMRLIKSGWHDELLRQKIDDALINAGAAGRLDAGLEKRLLANILQSEQQTLELIPVRRTVKKQWVWAAAAAVFVAALMAFWLMPEKKILNDTLAQKENKLLQPVVDGKGKKYIRLQDGSTVLLNEGSTLEYPDDFAKGAREVSLQGEGYFDIKHEAGRPFIVHTGKVNTIVLGTAFNIKAYPGQKEITVTVTRGKVKVSDGKKTIGVLSPNESIQVNTDNKSYRQETVNADAVVEWKREYLVLDNIPMGEAAVLIEKKYHVSISFAREEIKDCRISATFLNNENLEQVLTVLTTVVNGAYSMQPNDQVIFSGRGCR